MFSFVVHTVHTIQTIRTHPNGPSTRDVCRLHRCTALYGSVGCTNCRSLPEAIAPSNAEANAGGRTEPVEPVEPVKPQWIALET